MYAIIEDGGRQYKVTEGQEFNIDFRPLKDGEELRFTKVLACSGETGLKVGTPQVGGASVVAQVLGPTQGPKLVVQKIRRRKNSRRRTGHRQLHTRVKITRIDVA